MPKKQGPTDESKLADIIPIGRDYNPDPNEPAVEVDPLVVRGLRRVRGVDNEANLNFTEPESDSYRDGGDGDRQELSREQLIDNIVEEMDVLDISYKPIENRDRFGAGLLLGMSLLVKLGTDKFEGNIGQFVKHSFGPKAKLNALKGEKIPQVRNLEALRAINSLAILQNRMAGIDDDMPAGPVIGNLTNYNSSVLLGDEIAEKLIDEIAQDTSQLVRNLSYEDSQEVQVFMERLKLYIFAASRLPEPTSYFSYRSKIRGDYADEAWERFFNINYEGPTDSAA